MPTDLAEALALSGARETFDGLAPSRRKEHVRAIQDAKTSETRARRIAATIAKLVG
ncbi:uncharacterized protein YdeI (YjbR/CyaY-like superfamily) [Cryobacterium sp. MP_M5]|uniref:YdeI/OmpD-associated family protein n=1 Tax=unclassified Cryobacterium TaxID=2649013 RepID=UPI001A33CC41|nr:MULTISPECIES: YdeI/OmpD-associated family protein [unclassified Cryobacterium]MBG6059691.1 uncharacterized protein YdeI (YjbR/CyaY-like superfamily) [Cryobacterium sp. MP_M3]MEC5178063.1 uncharacterized protein YdeI (YjbR/CyaY-like superfamily) [Cryobacterium sp. MP_M5]